MTEYVASKSYGLLISMSMTNVEPEEVTKH